MNPAVSVPMGEIVVDDSLQPRCDGVSDEHIEALMEAAGDWPPIVAARVDGSLLLVDGFHRFEAARRLRLETVPTSIFEPAEGTDLFSIAFQLNSRHGRPLALADRKAYARRLLREFPELSDRELGRRAALNHETIRVLRAELRGVYPANRSPGELPKAVGLFDPLRYGHRATKDQKAIAGYVARLAAALDDPYNEDSTLESWPNDPAEVARACVGAMGPKRATETLRGLEIDARFMLSVVKAARTLTKEAS